MRRRAGVRRNSCVDEVRSVTGMRNPRNPPKKATSMTCIYSSKFYHKERRRKYTVWVQEQKLARSSLPKIKYRQSIAETNTWLGPPHNLIAIYTTE